MPAKDRRQQKPRRGGNFRKLTTALTHTEVRALEAAMWQAKKIKMPLDTLVTFAPWWNQPRAMPEASEVAAVFRRFLKHVAVWTSRHTGKPFTAIRVCHGNENSGGIHMHIFMHGGECRSELQAALETRYPPRVTHVEIGSEKIIEHPGGYHGSTFGYIIRFMTQQAFKSLRNRGFKFWRASAPDENGRYRAIKCPFVGKRWATTRNINAKAQAAYTTSARIKSERHRIQPHRPASVAP